MLGENSAELRRVRGEIPGGQSPSDVIVRLRVECKSVGASSVLERAREVMEVLLTHLQDEPSPALAKWQHLLPEWFVGACAQEKTMEEARRWLEWWRSLPPDEQAHVIANEPWTLRDWLHWFLPGPDARQWRWWHADLGLAEDSFNLEIVAESWPTAHGALDWILRAAGADSVEEEPSRG